MALVTEKSTPWRWNIIAHPEFKINLTFLYMHARVASQCTPLQAMVIGGSVTPQDEVAHYLLGMYCPDFPIRSFYSSQNVIQVWLRLAPQHILRFREPRFLSNYAKVSFKYEIHDNVVPVGSDQISKPPMEHND